MTFPLHRRSLLALAAGSLLGSATRAATYPDKPLTVIVPYPAGGPADVEARRLEPAMRKALGQPLVVENIAGASGSIGIQKLLAAAPDGYTLMLGTASDVILAPLTLATVRHKPEQLRLLGLSGRAPLVMVGSPAFAPTDLAQVQAAARGGRSVTYGSIGPGSLYHLAGEDLSARWKTSMTHVPYKGMAPLVQDLMGGHLDLALLPSAGNLVDLVTQGKLKAYAVADGQRLARLPQVPTFAEAGEAVLQDFRYEIWGGLFVDRRVPLALAQQLNAALGSAVGDAAFRQQMQAAGSIPGTPMGLEQADRLLTQQAEHFRRIAQAVRLTPQ